jgi:hypothetical protein
MSASRGYTIIYADPVFDHIRSIESKYHSLIKETILEQLQFSPKQIGRNKKPLTPPAPLLSSWEIRFGKICFVCFTMWMNPKGLSKF